MVSFRIFLFRIEHTKIKDNCLLLSSIFILFHFLSLLSFKKDPYIKDIRIDLTLVIIINIDEKITNEQRFRVVGGYLEIVAYQTSPGRLSEGR